MSRPVSVRLADASEWAACGAALVAEAGADTPLPALHEQIARRAAVGGPMWLIEIRDGERVLAVVPGCVEERLVRGVPLRLLVTPGDKFFDYLPSPFGAGVGFAEVRQGLRRALGVVGADAVLLPHLLPPWPEGCERWLHPFTNRCFDAALSPTGWDGLTRKESLRRHRKRARRELAYRVEHIVGRLPADALARIAELHRERWAFDDQRSAFAAPSRCGEYMACAERVLLSLVYDGEALFAAHIGLRFGGTMTWHTPVINVRYLDYSPLEVLLLETVEECARTGVRVLDFGLGDEPYKQRFSNATRPVANLFLPGTWRGRLASALLRRSSLDGLRGRLLGQAQRFLGRRAEGGEWLLPPARGEVAVTRAASAVEVVAGFSRLVDLFRAEAWPLRRSHYARLRRAEVFLAVRVGSDVRVGFWCRIGRTFPAGAESAEGSCATPTAFLYDLTGCTAQTNESVRAALAMLSSPGTLDNLLPAAAACPLRVGLRRDQPGLRAALLAAGWRRG